jgi:hypothetical protein
MRSHPPWQPDTIKSVVSEARPTDSQVAEVETDQGRGFLKALGNGAGTHSLAVELVATRLAAWFGLPTLTAAVIPFTGVPEIRLQEGPLRLAQPGPAFITRTEIGTPWSGDEEELDAITNPQDLARVVIFDTWVRNCDRHLVRAGRIHRNRDNVFLSTEGAPSGRVILKPIDHARCFVFATELTVEGFGNPATVRDENLYGYFPEFKNRVREQAIREAIAKAVSITAVEADTFFVGLPNDWRITEDLKTAWRQLILDRAAFLAGNADRVCSLL